MRTIVMALLALCGACASPLPVTGVSNDAFVAPQPWAERNPTLAEYRDAYPMEARRNNLGGAAELLRTVLADRRLDCTLHSETPEGYGFGAAARRLARYYVVKPASEDPRVANGTRILLPIHFAI